MPRITPYRILRGLALPWIVMLGLWFCLPSPTISAAKRGTYIQKALASGQQVTTVFEWSSSFSKRLGAANFMGESTTLIIPWQLVSIRTGVGKYDIYLRMTDHSNKDLQESSINLSAAIADATKINGFPSSDEKRWAPYRTNPRIIDMIPAGDPEEEVNMPWFHSADKAIIHYNMHGFYGEVDVDVVVPSTGVAEIWKHAVLQDALDATREKQTNRTAISADSYASQGSTPAFAQLYKHITSTDRQTGILAVIKLPPKAQMRDVLIERLDGELPSKTLPIRKALMFPLGPVLSIFSGLFMLIPGLIHLLLPIFVLFFIVYTATVLVCWLQAGRPNIGLWASSFWMTRWWATCCGRNKRSKKRDVWGPLGPLKSKGGRNGYDEEKAVGLQRPQTVRLGRTRKGSYT